MVVGARTEQITKILNMINAKSTCSLVCKFAHLAAAATWVMLLSKGVNGAGGADDVPASGFHSAHAFSAAVACGLVRIGKSTPAMFETLALEMDCCIDLDCAAIHSGMNRTHNAAYASSLTKRCRWRLYSMRSARRRQGNILVKIYAEHTQRHFQHSGHWESDTAQQQICYYRSFSRFHGPGHGM
jgi:hypothetical protein